LKPYSLIVFLLWPLFTVGMAAIEFRQVPYFAVPWTMAFAGSAAGAALLFPDFLIVGVLCGGVAAIAFASMSAFGLLSTSYRLYEPLLLFLSSLFWTSILFPTVTSMAAMALFHELPYFAVVLLLAGIVCLGCFIVARRNTWHIVLALVMSLGLLPSLSAVGRSKITPWNTPQEPPLVLLGLDSLSQHDDLTPLKSWSAEQGGTWYSKPVPPGLLTNSVWTSLLTERYVKNHGVFHVFQSASNEHAVGGLIARAKALGYWTISVFPDQLTCWVGSNLPFNESKSGPPGWRQLAISFVSNASVLLPLIRTLSAPIPFSPAPANQAGTFTYDLNRELREILTAQHSVKRVFVAAHTTYLHSPVYPRATELSRAEWKRILRAPAKSLRDRSLDWQDVDLPSDAIPLRKWKLRRLQVAVTRALADTRFLERGGQLVLFSDHGDRAGMTVRNFTNEKYHRVMLVTFGLPSRKHDTPISLLDVGSLLGLNPGSLRFEPRVEFTLADPVQWPSIAKTAKPRFDGTIELNQDLLKAIFQGLRTHTPWVERVQ
jgi:hypothetical protein